MSTPTLEALRGHHKTRAYIEIADAYLEAIGYTEHGVRHCNVVSSTATYILQSLGYSHKDVELVGIAGMLHDIGNMAGRVQHHRLGALLAKEVMQEMGFEAHDIGRVMAAIVMHEEDEGVIKYDPVAAALVIADKSDVHRSRVRSPQMIKEDIHDRVNYAATESKLEVDAEGKAIRLSLTIDTRLSQVIEYFEIFLSRMSLCRKAATALDCEFQLYINKTRMA